MRQASTPPLIRQVAHIATCCLLLLLCVCVPQGSWNLRDVQFPAGSQIKSWAFTTLVDPSRLVPGGETGTDTFLSVREGPGVCGLLRVLPRGHVSLCSHGAALETSKGDPHPASKPTRFVMLLLPCPACAPLAQDLVRMCNKTGVRCETPVKGPYDPRDTIEMRLQKAADLATQTFGTP